MNSQNTKTYSALLKRLGNEIQKEMRYQNIDQTELSVRSGLSQSTISNMINGKENVSMKKYFWVMETLQIDAIAMLTHCSDELQSSMSNEESAKPFCFPDESWKNFISDPDDFAFNGQLGKFHSLFHSTNRHDDKLIRGTLSLYPKYGKCQAELEILVENNSKDIPDGKKKYIGTAVISIIQKAVYLLLVNEAIGELCFLTYPYMQILGSDTSLECTMALALTVSSGVDSRMPTAHRMFLSRRKCDQKAEELISAQLMMNKSLIRIDSREFDAIRNKNGFSEEFINVFYKHYAKKEYYEIDEDIFKQLIRENKKFFEDLCILRGHSTSPKNNKISGTAINDIYRCVINDLP
ncbi:MAG: helix-turn-helix domain-containing protein [Clostridiales bacterium]|nr:helix-turn-helix domain-containing protein [Clostridiales bacterium]